MTPERWQQVAKIYEQVVDQDPTTREAYLAIACAGDATLRGEVESLLDDDRVSILDRPVWAAVAPLLGEGPVGAGDSLGPYRIDGRLGAGGMTRRWDSALWPQQASIAIFRPTSIPASSGAISSAADRPFATSFVSSALGCRRLPV